MHAATALSIGQKTISLKKLLSFDYWRKRTKTPVTATEANRSQEAPLWSIYPSLERLPLVAFIRCYVYQDYTALVEQGLAPQEALETAWQSLYSDYCTRSGGHEMAALIRRARQINALSSKIDRLSMLIDTVSQIQADELLAELEADGFKQQAAIMRTADEEGYAQQCRNIAAHIKPLHLQLKSMLREMPKTKKREMITDEDRQKTEAEFEINLAEMSVMVGHEVTDAISTARYCSYANRLWMKIEQHKKDNKNGRGLNK